MAQRKQSHRIQSVLALPGSRKLRVAFADGWEAEVDVGRFLADFPVFTRLSDDGLFARVALGDWGFDVTWDGGGDLSIAATTLYRLAAEQSDDPARRFDAWMARNGLSAAKAGEALGITRRMVIYYRTGKKSIPRYIDLACTGWEARSDASGRGSRLN
jgi:hypothetical protein